MQFEKSQHGLLQEAFRSEGEGANSCKRWGRRGSIGPETLVYMTNHNVCAIFQNDINGLL